MRNDTYRYSVVLRQIINGKRYLVTRNWDVYGKNLAAAKEFAAKKFPNDVIVSVTRLDIYGNPIRRSRG